jgi:hypothetical protein
VKDLLAAIENITSLDDLYGALTGLARTVERIVGSHRLSVDQLQAFAEQLAHVRHLIGVMAKQKLRPDADREILAVYTELEGRIKELRNDLSVPSREP